MNTEVEKLPMRKILDFLEMGRTTTPSTEVDPADFYNELEKLAQELEVEELALLGDAHYDGMCEMRELLQEQNLLENTNVYIKGKFNKELPDVDDSIENLVEFGNGTKIIISGVYPPIRDGNALFNRMCELSNKNNPNT